MAIAIAFFLVPSVLLVYLIGREWVENVRAAMDDSFDD